MSTYVFNYLCASQNKSVCKEMETDQHSHIKFPTYANNFVLLSWSESGWWHPISISGWILCWIIFSCSHWIVKLIYFSPSRHWHSITHHKFIPLLSFPLYWLIGDLLNRRITLKVDRKRSQYSSIELMLFNFCHCPNNPCVWIL